MSNKLILQSNNEALSANNIDLQNLIDQANNLPDSTINTCEISIGPSDKGLVPSVWEYNLRLDNNIIKPHFELLWSDYDGTESISYENAILDSYGMLVLDVHSGEYKITAKNISIIDSFKGDSVSITYNHSYIVLYKVTPSIISHLYYNEDSITIETTEDIV